MATTFFALAAHAEVEPMLQTVPTVRAAKQELRRANNGLFAITYALGAVAAQEIRSPTSDGPKALRAMERDQDKELAKVRAAEKNLAMARQAHRENKATKRSLKRR